MSGGPSPPADAISFEKAPGGAWILRSTQTVPLSRPDLFPFFADAANLARITPPEMGVAILSPTPVAMGEGALIDYQIRLWGLPLRWRTRIARWDPPRAFIDEQLRGPYAEWVHRHRFTELPAGETLIEDEVRFRLPLGRLGALGAPIVRWQLRRIFGFRRATIAKIFGGDHRPNGAPEDRAGGVRFAGSHPTADTAAPASRATTAGAFTECSTRKR